MPSKLPNLVASNCGLLLVTDKDSEIQNLFQTYNLGEVVNSWDNIKLNNALVNLLSNEQKNKVRANRDFLINNLFSLESLVNKII